MPKHQYAVIAVPHTTDILFHYLVPTALEPLLPGHCVAVPFGTRQLPGILIERLEHSEYATKKIIRCLAASPVLSEIDLLLAQWVSRYYHNQLSQVLRMMLPPRLKQSKVLSTVCWTAAKLTEQGEAQTLEVSDKNLPLFTVLQQSKTWVALEKLRMDGISRVAHRLSILSEQHQVQLGVPQGCEIVCSALHALNRAQHQVVESIKSKAIMPTVHLLDAVTGSGKTEIYRHLAVHWLQKETQVLILVPEIGLLPQMYACFYDVFGASVGAFHSKQAQEERSQIWQAFSSGQLPILIGTRSAALVPAPKLGLIIIDEEQDSSYYQSSGAQYHARDLLLKRASLQPATVVMGSATPSAETYLRALNGEISHHVISQPVHQQAKPQVIVCDLAGKARTAGLTEAAYTLLQDCTDRGEQALVFLNRRGFASSWTCDACGWVAQCTACDRPFTLHKNPAHLKCHWCHQSAAWQPSCQQCGHQASAVGIGTEQIEHILMQRCTAPIYRIDRDSMSKRQAWYTQIKRIKTGQPCILVGTQMLSKGHDFPKLTLVVVVDLDSAMLSSDFRSYERAAQLLIQVAGRAGRADKPGTVFIQSHFPQHPDIQQLSHLGYDAVMQRTLEKRQQRSLPPVYHWACVRAEAPTHEQAQLWLEQCALISTNEVKMIGPMPAYQAKLKGKYRAVIQLYAAKRSELHGLLVQWEAQMKAHKAPAQLHWAIEIDPIEVS